MDIDDLVLVSVDDHVVEPPDMFEAHLPERWRDVAPHHARRNVAPLLGQMRLEHVGRLDDVVVDAHQDQIVQLHRHTPLATGAHPCDEFVTSVRTSRTENLTLVSG